MAVSKNRIDVSRFLLRLAIGGMAIWWGFDALRHSSFPATFMQVAYGLLHLIELVCGLLVVIGLLMPAASLVLAVVVAWPLVAGWLHGAPLLGNLHGLFLLLVTLAAAVGGAGRWAVGRD
jgi:uncharacterized membrane protein YphA (DoxX/SURF4 family)